MKSIFKISLLSLVVLFAFSCKKDKASAVKGEAAPVATSDAATATYNVIQERSSIKWTGEKLAGTHMGTLNVSSGTISMKDGKAVSGNFTIDMNSLTCTDLEAGQGKEKLEGHLKNADFFDVGTFPTATFEITKVTALEGDANANSLVYGNLTIKDVTKQIGFKAGIYDKGSGVTVNAPAFTINRTDFGITYGSSSLMDVVKDKAINDNVKLEIKLGAM